MQMLTLSKNGLKANGQAALFNGVLPPSIVYERPKSEVSDLSVARAALTDAERVIRAQEDRIRHLESLALTDELTGLLNRRGFTLALQRELSSARRDVGASGVLIILDLDGFKSINDMWGHGAGDDYLQAVAHALLSEVRSNDIVARIGGDEFAILFPRMSEEIGLRRMLKLERNFNSRMMSCNDKDLPLRASFGLSSYNGLDTPEVVIATADTRLYAHKARRQMERA